MLLSIEDLYHEIITLLLAALETLYYVTWSAPEWCLVAGHSGSTHGALVKLSFQFSGLFVMKQENINLQLGSAFILRPARALAWTASRFLYARTDNQKLHGS